MLRRFFLSLTIAFCALMPTLSVGIGTAQAANDEIHYTITGPTSVSFDWRGAATTISYGPTASYGSTVTAAGPVVVKENGTNVAITPNSSAGPFREARITGLAAGTTYHYSIGGSADQTFHTPLAAGTSGFTVAVEGDVGNPAGFPDTQSLQNQINGLSPDLVLGVGDYPYANGTPTDGQVDAFFGDAALGANNGVEAFALRIPFETAWGNHEIDHANDSGTCTGDNPSNYKGRFDFANPKEDPVDTTYCNDGGGEDWHWFDYGNTRFISYPEPFTDDWATWNTKADAVMSAAQSNANIKFIVTYGHRPAWSTGYHSGETQLATYIKNLHAKYAKYVLNLNGHSHDYERSNPTLTDGVTNVTAGTGGGYLENVNSSGCLWQSCPAPSWSVQRFMRYGVTKLAFSATGITGTFYCGPPGGGTNDVTCTQGAVLDTFTIGSAPTDTTAPTTGVTAPANNATVSGTTTITATAADDTAVTKVDFLVDGGVIGTDTTSPYSLSWDTTAVANGTHTLTTKAYDAASNIGTSSVVTVTVQQPVSCASTPDPTLGASTQSVSVPSTATYKAWSRIMAPDTTNNSYYMQIDSSCAVNVGDSASIPAGAWTWVDYQDGNTATKTTMSLTAGTHTIKMIGREANVKVDEVLLLSDQTCVPTGTGTNCASVPDTAAPSTPTGLSATATNSSQVVLQWTASTDNVGVTGYKVMRNGTQIATATGTTYTDTAVTASTSYSYTVSAFDAAGNISAASSSVAVTVPDTILPTATITAPTNTATVSGSITVTATATDNIGVTKVEFYLDGGLALTDTTAPYSYPLDTTLLTNGPHTLVAKAYDTSANVGTSATVNITVNNDKTAPTAPTGLTATAASPTQVNLSWTAATDNVGVTKYIVQRGGVTIATPATTSYSDAGLTSGTSYSYVILAQDAAGNTSPPSVPATITTPQPPDTTPPTAPAGLSAVAASGTQVNLSWTASTDANGVAGYNILRGGTKIATSLTTSYGDTTVAPGTSYTYTVTAFDAAGNTSAASGAATVATPAPDTMPPTVSISTPAAGATVSGTVTFGANAADNTAVARVDFLVDNVVKFSDTTSPYSYSWGTSAASAGIHTLKVTAFDAAGNSASATITVTVNPKPADLNGDGAVNIFDLSILLSNWGRTGASVTGDINHDGAVNIFDLSMLLSAWGK